MCMCWVVSYSSFLVYICQPTTIMDPHLIHMVLGTAVAAHISHLHATMLAHK